MQDSTETLRPRVRPRRCRILLVPEQTVLELLWCGRITERNESCFLRALTVMGEPADVELLTVHHDPLRRCFQFLLYHESYPETPEGCLFENVATWAEVVEIPARTRMNQDVIEHPETPEKSRCEATCPRYEFNSTHIQELFGLSIRCTLPAGHKGRHLGPNEERWDELG